MKKRSFQSQILPRPPDASGRPAYFCSNSCSCSCLCVLLIHGKMHISKRPPLTLYRDSEKNKCFQKSMNKGTTQVNGSLLKFTYFVQILALVLVCVSCSSIVKCKFQIRHSTEISKDDVMTYLTT